MPLTQDEAVQITTDVYDACIVYGDMELGDRIIAKLAEHFPEIDWKKAVEHADG